MDILTFIASLVQALAWPMAAVVLIILLRKPLGSLLPMMRKLRYKDLEADFGAELMVLERRADDAGLLLPAETAEPEPAGSSAERDEVRKQRDEPSRRGSSVEVPLIQYVERVADKSPEKAMSEASTRLARAVRALYATTGRGFGTTIENITHDLLGLGLISDGTAEIILQLESINHRAFLSRIDDDIPAPTAAEAREFARLVERVIGTLDDLREAQATAARRDRST